MKKIIYISSLLFFVSFTNTVQFNFAKFFSYKKIVNGLCGLSIAAPFANPFYEIATQKIKDWATINTINRINEKKIKLYKTVDAYNPKIYTNEENKSLKDAYDHFGNQVTSRLRLLQNEATHKNIREHYKDTQKTKQTLNTMYNNAITCLNASTKNPSVAEHNRCLSLWKEKKND